MHLAGRSHVVPVRAAALAIAVVVGFAGVGVAGAAPSTQSTPRTLAVSTPSDATTIAPGRTGTIPVRIVNAGAAAIVVTMAERGITLADDGKARIASGPDPQWRGRVDFPTEPITIPARSYVGVPLRVRLPSRISGDLYFIGFVVTPEARSTHGVAVVNQIGSFFTIDVPGPRSRELSAVLVAPNFVFGSFAHGGVRIHNIGHASAQFWGENDTTTSPGSDIPTQQRIDKQLLPIGTARSYAVSGKSSWPIGIVTMKIHLVYPDRTGSETVELLATKRVLVANPIACAAVLGVLLVIALSWRRRRRRRHPRGVRGRPIGKARRVAGASRAAKAQGRARRAGPRGRDTFEDRLRRARSSTGR